MGQVLGLGERLQVCTLVCIVPRMPRVTVFVPEDVFAEMQAVRTRTGPNWSQVATTAFQKTIQELKRARSATMSAVELPYPTAGDWVVFEVRQGGKRYQVKVSGTARACRYRHPLPRIVEAVARDYLEEHPQLEDGSILPVMVSSTLAEQFDAKM